MSDKTPLTRTPDSYRQRDLAILRQVGLYGIGVTESISSTIGRGSSLAHVVRRLADDGLLTLHSRALEGGVSYVQCTEQGAERIGVPKDRCKPMGTQALDKALAVLVWCVLSDTRRYKIERDTLHEIFPTVKKFPTNQVHAVSEADGRRVVWRQQLVQGNHEPALTALKEQLASVSGELRQAIESEQYGFVLLVDSVVKQKVVEAAVAQSGLRESALVRVDLSATAKTLAAYLRRLKSSKT